MTLLVSLHADVGEIPKYAIHHQAPPPDAWISTFGVDAPFSGASYSEYQRVDDSAARTEHRKRLRGRRTAGGLDEKGMRARALSRKAGSVSAKAETSECKEHPWCDITVAPRGARVAGFSASHLCERLRESQLRRRCGERDGGDRCVRSVPLVAGPARADMGRGTHANAFCGITGPEGQN